MKKKHVIINLKSGHILLKNYGLVEVNIARELQTDKECHFGVNNKFQNDLDLQKYIYGKYL